MRSGGAAISIEVTIACRKCHLAVELQRARHRSSFELNVSTSTRVVASLDSKPGMDPIHVENVDEVDHGALDILIT